MPEPTVPWGESWIWLGGSLLLIVLSANAAWLLRQARSGPTGGFIARLTAWRFSPWLLQALRLLVYIGVPFAALLWGHDAVFRRLLGLQPLRLPTSKGVVDDVILANNWPDWARDAGWAAALGLGVWGLLALGWWAYRRALAPVGESGTGTRKKVSGWVLLREAAYHEAHWAFYRNAPILTLGAYWGTWLGLILVGIEAMLNPAWRRGLADAERAPAQLMRMALAVISSILFLQARNLWLAFLLHFGVSAGLTALAGTLPIPVRQMRQPRAQG